MRNLEQNNILDSVDLEKFLSALWHWAWLVILATLLAGITAFIISNKITPVYQANSTILVNEASSNQTIDNSSLQLSSQLSQTYSQMIIKQPILIEVAKRLGIEEIDPETLSAKAISGTQLVNLTVESTDPEMAANIANEIVIVFSEEVRSLQADRFSVSKQSLQTRIADIENQILETSDQISKTTNAVEKNQLETKLDIYKQTYTSVLQSLEQIRLAEDQLVSTIVQVEPATPPEIPIHPNILLYTALATAVGLLLAMVMVFIIDLRDDTLKTPDDITKRLELPVLGIISHIENNNDVPITELQPRLPVSEAFRNLRTNLLYAKLNNGKNVKTILVTSITAGAGKSTIVSNLGVVMAHGKRKVVLVDADLRRPKLHKLLGCSNNVGLSDALALDEPKLLSKLMSEELIHTTRINNLSVVTAGTKLINSTEFLDSDNIHGILKVLRDRFDIVIIDTPPTLAVTDASALAPFVDGVVLVLKPSSTRNRLALHVIEQLNRIGANLLGIVLNDIDPRKQNNRYYYDIQYEYQPININDDEEKLTTTSPEKSNEDFVEEVME